MTELKRAKAHKILAKSRANDPVISMMTYDHDILMALNHYNINHDNKEKKAWSVAYFPKVKFSSDIPDFQFKTLGTLVRIVGNGYELSDRHQILMDNELARLKNWVAKKVEVEEVKPVVSVQAKMDMKVSEFLGEFAGLVDEFTMTGSHPKIENLVNNMGIKGPMIKKVVDRVSGSIAELKEAYEGKDKQLVEGYSNFKKTELRKLIGIYETLITTLGQAKVTVVRKVRTPKAKTPMEITKNVKYQVENKDLNLKSLKPAAIVGASEVWLYNTKYRKLCHVEASMGQTLTMKGMGIMNFDVNKSTMKLIKKPELLQSQIGKRMWTKFFKETKGTEGKYNARLSEHYIILAVF